MTTINRVRVESINGPVLTCHVDHVYGSQWQWYLVPSRTLALHFLWESLTPDRPGRAPSGRRIPRARVERMTRASPLWNELAGRDLVDEHWNRANVGQFISCVGMVDHQHCDEMWANIADEMWDADPNLWHTKDGFKVHTRRWVVERTFAWLTRYRRLMVDFEYYTETTEAMIQAAMIHRMLRRLYPTS